MAENVPGNVRLNDQLGHAAEACPTCGSDCNERDELIKAEREIERLRAALASAYGPSPYYVSGPYPTDGGWAMCELSTGRIVHRVPGA